MDVSEIASQFGSGACLYTEKRAIRCCCWFSQCLQSLPTGYGKSLCYACLPFHVEPHLLAPPEVVIIAFQQNKSAYRMAQCSSIKIL